MKKLFLLCVIALVGFVNAQEKEAPAAGFKGAWWAMGTVNFSNTEEHDLDEKVSHFKIMPIVGTFVSPTVTVGLGAGYESVKVGDADAVDGFIVMPLARKYWGVANNLYIFGQAAVPMSFSDDVNTFGFQLSPGIDYFLSGHFTIEASLGLLGYSNTNPDVGDSYGKFDIGVNTGDLSVGLKYVF
ncbi:outer membrane beta-barrel protein [Flavobacteriaceae bacterium Ap0902]|nr:outer membrane beta-barrel protein [Flavobacteriaceae bacterium Ap0902]